MDTNYDYDDQLEQPIDPIKPDPGNAFEDNSDFSFELKLYSLVTLKIFTSIIAIYLSWKCNGKTNIFLKIIYSIFNVIFSELYIIYYAIYRVYMGNKCS